MPTGVSKGVLEGHSGYVTDVSLCISVAPQSVFSCSRDKSVREWDVSQMRLVRSGENGHIEEVRSLCSAPEEGLLVSASWDSTCLLWDARALRRRMLVYVDSPATSVCFRNAQRQLCVGTYDGRIFVFDIRNVGSCPLRTIRAHRVCIRDLNDVADANCFVSATDDHTCRSWSDRGKELWATNFGCGVNCCIPFVQDPERIDLDEEERLAYLSNADLVVRLVAGSVSLYKSLVID